MQQQIIATVYCGLNLVGPNALVHLQAYSPPPGPEGERKATVTDGIPQHSLAVFASGPGTEKKGDAQVVPFVVSPHSMQGDP